LDKSVGGKTGKSREKMMGIMRRILSHGSAGSFLMPACLPAELSNFLTIRPFNVGIYTWD
jgi:hypothetical protein